MDPRYISIHVLGDWICVPGKSHECPSAREVHYGDVIMATMMSQITSLAVVYSIVYSGADQRKHQSSAALAFVRGIYRGPVNSPHKWPATRKMFPFHDVIMNSGHAYTWRMNPAIIHTTQCVWSLHGAFLGPTGPRWAPCWPHDPCYLGRGPFCWHEFTLIPAWISNHIPSKM